MKGLIFMCLADVCIGALQLSGGEKLKKFY